MTKNSKTPTFARATNLEEYAGNDGRRRKTLDTAYNMFGIPQSVTTSADGNLFRLAAEAIGATHTLPLFRQLPLLAAFIQRDEVTESFATVGSGGIAEIRAPIYVKVGKSTAICVYAYVERSNDVEFHKVRVQANTKVIPASMSISLHVGKEFITDDLFATWVRDWYQADEERNEGETLAKNGKTDFEIMQEEERLNVGSDGKPIIGDAAKKMTKKEHQKISAQQKFQEKALAKAAKAAKRLEKKADKTRKAMKGAKKAAKRGS